jgi:5,10-methylene-tetrahydrofolate dehydrogenase/methenyl tetrahydrofolate cyclohydrolase
MFKMSDGMTDMLEEEGRPSKVHLSSIQMAAMQKTDKVTQAAYMKAMQKEASDGTTASYYELPEDATELQDLISAKNMNYSVGSIFVLCYEHGEAQSVQSRINIVKGIIKHAEYERKRLEAMYPM